MATKYAGLLLKAAVFLFLVAAVTIAAKRTASCGDAEGAAFHECTGYTPVGQNT